MESWYWKLRIEQNPLVEFDWVVSRVGGGVTLGGQHFPSRTGLCILGVSIVGLWCSSSGELFS